MKTNTIYCGDCTAVMQQYIPDNTIDLIYVDPPFFSNKQYEILWGDGYELRAFEDRWKGGTENYISWMEPKLRECHRVLKDTGSMYLHCDWHANAHLRILMDDIFGENNFLNEIIWWYHDPAGTVKDRFKKKHDMIFFYAKTSTKERIFNMDAVRQPYSEGTLQQAKHGVISFGRPTKTHPVGKVPEDVWEIPFINSQAKERLGYPTQKPEALLERIIQASSNPLDIVLDPMCGCGTAIAVAHKLGRRWIGIDVSPTACKLMTDRMRKLGVSIGYNDIIGMPKTLKEIADMQPFEFQNWVCQRLTARVSKSRVGDMGIDGWLIDGRPLQVKQSESVGRNVVDNFETAIRRANKSKGIIVALSFGKGAYEEAARVKLHDGLEIELKTVEDLVKEE